MHSANTVLIVGVFVFLVGASRSPRPDGFDQEADLVASANSSDYSSEHDGEQTRPSLAMATSRDNTSFVQGTTEGRDAVGREGHAGGSTKVT